MREGTRGQTGEWEGTYGEVDRQVDGGIWGKLDVPCGSVKEGQR